MTCTDTPSDLLDARSELSEARKQQIWKAFLGFLDYDAGRDLEDDIHLAIDGSLAAERIGQRVVGWYAEHLAKELRR